MPKKIRKPAKKCAAPRQRLLLERAAVLACIPTNWCDDLLTGPGKVIADGHAYGNPDIERLLLAVRARIEALPTTGKI